MTLHDNYRNRSSHRRVPVYLNAGRNAIYAIDSSVTINESVGGDQTNRTSNQITMGGVGVSREQLKSVMNKFLEARCTIEEKVTTGEVDNQKADDVIEQLEIIQKEVTKRNGRANGDKLARAGRMMLKLSPVLVGTLVSIFADPIIGEITQQAGSAAIQFVQHLGQFDGAGAATT